MTTTEAQATMAAALKRGLAKFNPPEKDALAAMRSDAAKARRKRWLAAGLTTDGTKRKAKWKDRAVKNADHWQENREP